MKLGKFLHATLGLTRKLPPSREEVARRELMRLADEARDRKHYVLAAELYEQVLRTAPQSFAVLVQCGHMYKESMRFADSEACYMRALSISPRDGDLLLQLGHFHKVALRYSDAEYYYQEALKVQPDREDIRTELSNLRKGAELRREQERVTRLAEVAKLAAEEGAGDAAVLIDRELFPRTRNELYFDHHEAFVFTRNGVGRKTRWGEGLTVRGVDPLRGYIVSPIPFLHIEIYLDGKLIHRSELVQAPQRRERSDPHIKKWAYNAWIDFTNVPRGWHDLFFRAVNVRGDAREGIEWRRERIIVADPVSEGYFPDSDGAVPPTDPTSPLSVAEQVNARPSVVHRATTRSFPGPIKTVAIVRPDQLGDMCVSVPALLRLRGLLPEARLVGLLSPANEGLARSLGVFDEVVLLDFPDDPHQRHRVMDEKGQQDLARQLAPYKFDVAINFPIAGNSYRLLPLTGAPITLGFGGDGYKTLGLSLSTHDPKSNNDVMRHSARTRALAEMVAVWLDSGATVVRRADLDRDVLAQYGIGAGESYALLHSGARIKFTQWPHYAELARKIVETTETKVVFMADDDAQRDQLPEDMLRCGQIVFVAQQLQFDHFDAFMHFCSVFVGNDSGPKHLAALRGAPVVSLHSSRIAWDEWGQEQTGVIISRRVPCAGCSLHHDPEECAQGVACITRISVDEVLHELQVFLGRADAGGSGAPASTAA
jgi:ADP-heptose:LPS heptosyltransferase/tetratricopeptide (TPR) repeat protein